VLNRGDGELMNFCRKTNRGELRLDADYAKVWLLMVGRGRIELPTRRLAINCAGLTLREERTF
jgi:hypothetical protein